VRPSHLSLLGIVRHMTDMERAWFHIPFRGEPLPRPYDYEDAAFELADPGRTEADFAAFTEECDLAPRAAARASLSDFEQIYFQSAPQAKYDAFVKWLLKRELRSVKKNFFMPNGHGPDGPSRAMWRLLPVAGHAVNHVWEAGAVLTPWIWVRVWATWSSQPVSSAAVGASS
jgi:hypothetical protein